MRLRVPLLALLAAGLAWPAWMAAHGPVAFDGGPDAFSGSLARSGRSAQALEGKALFGRDWTAHEAGIAGPLLNADSCTFCHFRNGRGQPHPEPGAEPAPVLLRLSVPGGGPEPVYGGQLNDRGVRGVAAEGIVATAYSEVRGQYADGEPYVLRKPRHRAARLAHGPMDPRVMVSPRIPPMVFGLGLLEAVPEEEILAPADPEDRDGDGISGRPNRVWSAREGRVVLGRFGWKANQPTVEQQTASAYLEDLGLTSPLYPQANCPPRLEACRAAGPELTEHQLQRTALFVRLLAPPSRQAAAAEGRALFERTGCAACHRPTLRTGEAPDLPELAGQTIHPYTDLLLHDLGDELADGRPDSEATGREWRTAPLWGLGLLEAVNGQTRLLHDGRARSFEEAILWHGGEAAASRERFRKLDRAGREALVGFLRSL